MKTIRCQHCQEDVIGNPRCPDQQYCSKKGCQRVRRRRWQKEKMKTDPDYRVNQKQSQKQWQENHKGYWKAYRRKKKQQAKRNRIQQHFRNHGVTICFLKELHQVVFQEIAKMDSLQENIAEPSGLDWAFQKIAKMDSMLLFVTDIKKENLHLNKVRAKKDSIASGRYQW